MPFHELHKRGPSVRCFLYQYYAQMFDEVCLWLLGFVEFRAKGLACTLWPKTQERPGKELKEEIRELVSGGAAKVKRESMEEEAPSFPL